MAGQTISESERPRSASELIGATFELYRSLPLLFPTLAAAVVIPYWLIVFALTGGGPETTRSLGTTAGLILFGTGTILVSPLISALHVHAVDDVREGRRPEFGSVARRGLRVLPVVSAAVVVAAIGSGLGLILLIVPGVLLWLRWSVVAQTAALEEGGWIDALKRSHRLTHENYWHIFGLFLLVGVILAVPSFLVSLAFRHHDTTVLSFVVGTAFVTLTSSFGALSTAVLFFDLRVRLETDRTPVPAPPPPSAPGRPPVDPTGHPLDPDSYSDEDRPHGWYVVPDAPWQMRHWPGDGPDGFSKRKTKTPKKTLAGWYKAKDH
jgi:uncharacterized membrane protein